MLTRSVSKRMTPILYYNTWHSFHAPKSMHPENPQRITGILKAIDVLIKANVFDLKTFTHPTFKLFESDPETEIDEWIKEDGDNYRTKYTDSILEISHTMIKTAVDDILNGRNCAYVLTRPPGHHASPGIESGFCFENNVWNAVEHLLESGLRRISIYDWDVHHGDGTERCFRAALARDFDKYNSVRFVSTHAYGHGIYPGTGAPSKDTHIFNCPFEKGTHSKEFLESFHTEVLPYIKDCDVLVISAGYDGHKEDPMGLMKLETSTYSEMSRYFKELGVPVLFILEGGYNPKILGDCVRETLFQWV